MTKLDPAERSRRGAATQSEVTGAPAPEPTTLLDGSWRDFVYAEVWTRPGLDRRSRYLIAMSTAACTNGPKDALDGYVRGALTQGALTLAELREAALHLAVYAGWSRGGELDAAISRVVAKLGLPPAEVPPIRGEAWDPAVRLQEGAKAFEKVMTFPGPPPVVAYFDAGILNFVFGEMWNRPGLDERARRFVTLVGVAESTTDIPIRSHFHAAMASGNCTAGELHEFVLQYAIHAGWPKASVVQGVVFEMAQKVAEGRPFGG